MHDPVLQQVYDFGVQLALRKHAAMIPQREPRNAGDAMALAFQSEPDVETPPDPKRAIGEPDIDSYYGVSRNISSAFDRIRTLGIETGEGM
jgi:hypothetical protein